MWFLSGFPWYRVAANSEATEPKVLLKLGWSHHFDNFRSPPWLSWPLWNICVTNDHGYVPLFVSISRSFPQSWLITGFITRLTRQVSQVEQHLPTLPEYLSSPSGFGEVPVTRSLVLCVLFCRSWFVFLYFGIFKLFFWISSSFKQNYVMLVKMNGYTFKKLLGIRMVMLYLF